jgi:hypothetical protein
MSQNNLEGRNERAEALHAQKKKTLLIELRDK